MPRKTIPKATREIVNNEYDHRCAICASDRPHLHHIDEDATNNDVLNLLPLCPNCHLTDQHNPTKKIEIGKLKLFRKYKDPFILKSQYHPIYLRSFYLQNVEVNDSNITELEEKSKELIEFISSMEMGAFYGKRLEKLIGKLNRAFAVLLGGGPDPGLDRQRRQAKMDYRKKLFENKDKAEELLVELLRYQKW
jgi:hypothetical protein